MTQVAAAEESRAAPQAAVHRRRRRRAAHASREPRADFKLRLVHEDEREVLGDRGAAATTHYTQFGKIGSPGQTRLSEIGSATAAQADADKRAMQKRKEGYKNVPLDGRRLMRALVVVALLASGCSYFRLKGLPADMPSPPTERPIATTRCSCRPSTVALPGCSLIGVISLINDQDPGEMSNRGQAIGFFSVLTAVIGVSAIVGFNRVGRCLEAKQAYDAAHPS